MIRPAWPVTKSSQQDRGMKAQIEGKRAALRQHTHWGSSRGRGGGKRRAGEHAAPARHTGKHGGSVARSQVFRGGLGSQHGLPKRSPHGDFFKWGRYRGRRLKKRSAQNAHSHRGINRAKSDAAASGGSRSGGLGRGGCRPVGIGWGSLVGRGPALPRLAGWWGHIFACARPRAGAGGRAWGSPGAWVTPFRVVTIQRARLALRSPLGLWLSRGQLSRRRQLSRLVILPGGKLLL